MNKVEYLQELDKLGLDKSRYCIIAGGVMLLHGLKDSTEDIDIKVQPDYFEELKSRFTFTKSPKPYPDLYVLSDTVEVAAREFDTVEIVDGYPTEPLTEVLAWMKEHKRPKDLEKIKIIENYLNKGARWTQKHSWTSSKAKAVSNSSSAFLKTSIITSAGRATNIGI